MASNHAASRWSIVVAFGLVYFFWGSTYLAIDIAVERIPPALMCGLRFFIAGSLMLAFCRVRGRRTSYPAIRLGEMAVVGGLLLAGVRRDSGCVGTGGAYCRYRPIVVSILRQSAAWGSLRSNHRESRTGAGIRRTHRIVVAHLDGDGLVGTRATLGWLKFGRRSLQLGAGVGAGEKMEVGRGRFVCSDCLSDDRGGAWQSDHRRMLGRFFEGRVDGAGNRRDHVSCCMRLVGGLYRVHIPVEPRQHVQGFDLCLCQSHRCGVFGMAGSP